MKQKKNHTLRNWFLGTALVGCLVLGLSKVTENRNPSGNQEAYLLGQVIYGEAANQSEIVREATAKTTLNRVGRPGYDSNLIQVINRKNAFSCMNGNGSKNWRQATGKEDMNGYERMIFKRCLQDAKDVLNGKRLGHKNEDKWVAYFDKTVSYEDLLKKNPRYWETVKPDVELGDLTFCVERN